MKKERRSKIICLYFTESEHAQLRELFETSTHRKFADFLHTLVLRQPLIKKIRNQSLDDLHLAAVGIKTDLEGIRRSITAAVERLKGLPSEASLEGAVAFLIDEELDLKEKLAVITHLLINIYEKCSQEQSPSQK